MDQAENPDREPRRAAGPQQPDTGFEEGLEQRPDTPDDKAEPNFARGQEKTPPEHEKPRYSRGKEADPASPEHDEERRFSEGQERGSGH